MARLRALLIVTLAVLALAPAAQAQTGQQLFQLWCQTCHGPAAGNVNNVLAGKEWTYIRLAIDTRPMMNEALRPLVDEGTITDDDLMLIAGYLQTIAGGAPMTINPVVEYFNSGFGHYFMTADADEINGLDAGAFDFAFLRSGLQFDAYAAPGAGKAAVCRFFTTPGTFGQKSSHFYTANAAECESLIDLYTPAAKSWRLESYDFPATPAANGACEPGLRPVYRAYNNGFARGIDSNHRITTDLNAIGEVTARGWIFEGIAMCVSQ